MADLQGLAYYPGINQLRSWSYTASHGITPGVHSFEIVPQDRPPEITGEVTAEYGGRRLKWPDCKLDSVSVAVSTGQIVWRLAVLDRRWKWAFGEITGSYNVRRGSNSLVEDSKKTPQELAKLCLEAMGEKKFDVAKMPNKSYPFVDWQPGQVPAQALANLVEEVGCRVMLLPDDSVAVLPAGEGKKLPLDETVMGGGETLDPGELPDEIGVVCGPNRFQLDFKLEAVGYELDGTVKPINELSYRPTGDGVDQKNPWGNADFPHLSCIADKKLRELAQGCVFRCYRIKGYYDEGGFTEIGKKGARIARIDQILPLENSQVEEVKPENLTQARKSFEGSIAKPATVFGVFYDPARSSGASDGDVNTAKKLKPLPHGSTENDYSKKATYRESFSIDEKTGIVTFGQAVFKLELSGESYALKPADLALRTACTIRDEKTRAVEVYRKTRKTGAKFGTKVRLVRHDEIFRKVVTRYRDSDSYTVAGTDDNKKDVDKECDYYLDALLKEYETKDPMSVDYAGLRTDIQLDGAISSITYNVGLSGTTTSAQRNTDTPKGSISYAEKRFYEQVKQGIANGKPPAIGAPKGNAAGLGVF